MVFSEERSSWGQKRTSKLDRAASFQVGVRLPDLFCSMLKEEAKLANVLAAISSASSLKPASCTLRIPIAQRSCLKKKFKRKKLPRPNFSVQ